jgi:hypothetical protein
VNQLKRHPQTELHQYEGGAQGVCLKDEFYPLATNKKSIDCGIEYDMMETLLKGYEEELPNGQVFEDKDGNIRKEFRLRWWLNRQEQEQARSILDIGLFPTQDDLPEKEFSTEDILKIFESVDIPKNDSRLKFFGHYWMRGKPKPLNPTTACLDWSVAKNGKLCAYRWDGETSLDAGKFVWVKD